MRWRSVAAAVTVVAATACSSHSNATSPGPNGTANLDRLIAVAHLRPCPTSSSTVVAGGLPNLTVPCLGHGPAVHLSGLIGKPTVVNLWGSWCIPCQAEEKYLSSAYDADHGKVRFLGVDVVDEADSALNFLPHVSPPVHYPSVFDPDRKVALGLDVASPPFTAFVSAAGKIVGMKHGGYSSTADLQADIHRFLHVTT
jgi:cytochrome c biogenesis protein CcmG, thiol:disulfide interchange protein DsbE